jgi:putative heme-binding domain-containing protein
MDHWRARLTDVAVVEADLIEGRLVYGISCGACHRLYGEGGDLGPDLTGSGRQNLDYLLENILFPHAVVPAGFRQSTLVLSDGRVLSGIIRERTSQSLTLALVGETLTIHRAEIEIEETAQQSMMPEGLLDALTEEQVTQLFAYLMSSRPVEE